MWTKHGLFLAIAIFFIFSYPIITRTWSLNYSIGWHGREFWTFLIPIWFLLVFLTYKKTSSNNIEISNYFFWLHLFLSIVPAFLFNYPFLKTLSGSFPTKEIQIQIIRSYQTFLVYSLTQILLYLFLLLKLVRR
jgi:hypothetical protein